MNIFSVIGKFFGIKLGEAKPEPEWRRPPGFEAFPTWECTEFLTSEGKNILFEHVFPHQFQRQADKITFAEKGDTILTRAMFESGRIEDEFLFSKSNINGLIVVLESAVAGKTYTEGHHTLVSCAPDFLQASFVSAVNGTLIRMSNFRYVSLDGQKLGGMNGRELMFGIDCLPGMLEVFSKLAAMFPEAKKIEEFAPITEVYVDPGEN